VYVPDASLEPTFTRMTYNADNDDLSRVEREGGELASAYWSAHPARWREQELWFDKEYAPEAIWERRQHEDGFYGSPLDVAPPGWVQSGGPTPENEPLHRLSAALGEQLTSGFSHHASRGERLARAGQILFLARLLQDPDYCWDRIGLDQDDSGRRLPRSWLVPSLAPDKRTAWARLVADALAEVAPGLTARAGAASSSSDTGHLPLLSPKAAAVRDYLVSRPPDQAVSSTAIAAALARQKVFIDPAYIRSTVVPALRPWGLKSSARGYAFPLGATARRKPAEH
jgi:hypothetical protein